ncbi:MAG: type II toxin-antitoxin system HicA family toxin [Candidatus Paceibacterota bacterium]
MSDKIIAVSWRKLHQYFLSVGCRLSREKGDHLIYERKDLLRPVVIPKDREIPVFIIKNNLRILGVSHEEYIKGIRKSPR